MIKINEIKYYTYEEVKNKATTKLAVLHPTRMTFGKKDIGIVLKAMGYVMVRKNVNKVNRRFYVSLKDYQRINKIL